MDRIRWGIIGTGDVAQRKGGPALARAKRSELVAVTNRNVPKAKDFAEQHGVGTVHRSVQDLLDDTQIEAVYVATPPDSHAELTVRAAEAGKHVLCEKPMALSVAEGEQMIAACKAQGVSLAVAYYRRYFPVVQQMKQLVAAGAVGSILRLSMQTYAPFGPIEGRPWRLEADISGGGFLMDVGSHRFDLMSYFAGQATDVQASWDTQSLPTQVDDVATVALRFAPHIHGSGIFHWNCPVHRDVFEITGTKGVLTTDSLSGAGRLQLETVSGTEHWQQAACAPVHLNLVQRFVDHLLDGVENPLSGESGLEATRMIESAYQSSASA